MAPHGLCFTDNQMVLVPFFFLDLSEGFLIWNTSNPMMCWTFGLATSFSLTGANICWTGLKDIGKAKFYTVKKFFVWNVAQMYDRIRNADPQSDFSGLELKGINLR